MPRRPQLGCEDGLCVVHKLDQAFARFSGINDVLRGRLGGPKG